MDTENLLSAIREVLVSHLEIVFAVLYGTAAKGMLNARSDVDIAVAADFPTDTERGSSLETPCGQGNTLSPEYKVNLLLALEKRVGRSVDLLDLRTAYGVILTEVLTKGKIIINKKPEVYAGLMKKMLFYNADMLPNYRMMLQARAKKIARGD